MSITSGRITISQLIVTGDAPGSVDEAMLSILSEHRFRETEIGAPDPVEAGFITGHHLFDTHFTYEKNAYGSRLLFGLRIDTHKVPGDVRQAYRRMNESAAASASPTGFVSNAEKRDAQEVAERQLHDDLAKGKFRRSKMVEVVWDLKARRLYVAATGAVVLEQLSRLMREAFAVDVEFVSAGTLAGTCFRVRGKGRDYEDLTPARFTPPPALARQAADDADAPPQDLSTPIVPWVARAVDLKDFLGNELLMYLWWCTARERDTCEVRTLMDRAIYIAIDRVLDMDCAWGAGGKDTFRGDGPTRLKEAIQALKTGKWPRKLGLIVADGEHQWQLTLQGDQWVIAAMALPDIEDAQSPRELTEARIELMCRGADVLEQVYASYLSTRRQSVPLIHEWIRTL